MKHEGTVIQSKLCSCYTQRIAMAELSQAQQLSDHSQVNIAQKKGAVHKAELVEHPQVNFRIFSIYFASFLYLLVHTAVTLTAKSSEKGVS